MLSPHVDHLIAVIEDEEAGDRLSASEGGRERGVVVEAEVTAVPQDSPSAR